jgi:formate dehydrogenase alpha subunit
VAGLVASFGSGAMTNSFSEIEGADVLLVIGSNTTEAHPVVGSAMKRVVKFHGTRLIVIDPRRTEIARAANIHLSPLPGTDVAYLNGMMNVIISEGLEDKQFIEERTEGFEELKKAVEKYTPEYVEEISGIPADDLREAARLYANAEKGMLFYTMGVTQHTSGTDNVMSVANLAMLTGNVGKESTGVNPLRGQSNVQGACDMGALSNVYPGYQSVTDDIIREKFETAWRVDLSPKVGLTIVEMIHAAHEGKVKGIYVMGENPMMSDPDVNHVKEALENVDFLVVQDIFLSETAQLADVVLPAASFAEKSGSLTNSERRVQLWRKAIEPVGESRPDWEIICDIATRMGYEMKYDSPAQIMDEIARLTPIYGGMSHDRLEGDGLQWPCPDKEHPGTQFLHKGRFSRGLGKFHAIEFRPPFEMPDEEYPLLLTTGRMLYHFHTGTLSRRSAGLDELHPEGKVEISPEDAAKLGIEDGDLVEVTSRRGKVVAKALVTDKSPVGTVFMTFHFREAAANLLTVSALDPVAKIPEYKVCAVKVEPAKVASKA